jgi:hypothetical protein
MFNEVINRRIEHDIDIHMNEEEAFRSACKGGYLRIAKYLIEICESSTTSEYAPPIDIHTYNEDAFRYACAEGSLRVVKYLAELHMYNTKSGHNYRKVDIHVYNEEPLCKACDYGHLDVVKYLIELHLRNPNYTKIDSKRGLEIARARGHMDIFEYLTNVNRCDHLFYL